MQRRPVPGVRLVALDRLGHGGSTAEPDEGTFDWSELVHELLELLDRLSIDRCVLMGHGSGCAEAIALACVLKVTRQMSIVLGPRRGTRATGVQRGGVAP